MTQTSDIVLQATDLGVHLRALPARRLLDGCSFTLRAGQRLTLVGESGAGKSLLAQAIMGTLPAALAAHGRLDVLGRATDGQRERTRSLWGRELVMLPQEPWTALNPLMRLGLQVAETGRHAAGLPWPEARARAAQHLQALGLAQAGGQWLHQVSGGMAQRVGIACASQSDARVLIADEPTKGLDAGACAQVADLLARAQRQGQALLTITHDLDLARHLGGELAVLRQGRIIEAGPADAVLQAPRHDYTRALIAAQPRHWPALWPVRSDRVAIIADEPLIRADDIGVDFGPRRVLDGASLTITAGQALAVVGPSGCGKTTLGHVLVGVQAIARGRVQRRAGVPAWRFQKLYQDPVASFAPGQRLRQGLDDLVRLHRLEAERIPALLQRLKLDEALLARHPGEVSGGELQRLALLRVLLLRPAFVFADEPTSRLDALTQRETLGLLCEELGAEGCALLLVSHDPDLARQATQQCWHMAAGRLQAGHPAQDRPASVAETGHPDPR
ncbi:ATP-binding cassette domain-containing protein [Pseudaquabacterium rugosum]|uniref:ATP-binding cassette domain-containing protein n=1 Tax=Pseudaquabacterium rugosum TaxID=2984194 RepID=A0ABU9BH49_9BURK